MDFQVISFEVNATAHKLGDNNTFISTLYVQRSISWWYNQYLICNILDASGKEILTQSATKVNIPTSPYVTKGGDKIPFTYTYKTWISQQYVRCIVKDFGNKIYISFYANLPALSQI